MEQTATTPGLTSNRTLYTVSLNHFINDGSTFIVSSLFPAMEVAFGFSILNIGILVAVGYLINMVFQPILGRLSSKHEPKTLLMEGISIIAVSMIIIAFSSTFLMILVSMVILKLGSSFFHPIGASIVSEKYSGSKLDQSMGVQSGFGNLGIVVSFVVSAPLYLALGWRGPFLIYAALQIITVIITMFALERIRGGHSSRERSASVESGPSGSGAELREEEHRESLLFTNVIGLPLFFVVISFIAGSSVSVLDNFGNLLLYGNGFRISTSNDLMSLSVGAAFFGAVATGRLTAMFSRLKLLTITYLIAGLSILGFSFMSGNVYASAVILVVLGFSISITYPAMYSELSDHISRRGGMTGTAYGVLFSSQIAGASLFGFLSGYVSGVFSLHVPFDVAGLLLIAGCLFTTYWSRLMR